MPQPWSKTIVGIAFPVACAALATWSWACNESGTDPDDSMNVGDDDDDTPGDDDDGLPDDEPFSHRGLLLSVAERVYRATYAEFVVAAQELAVTSAAASQAAASGDSNLPASIAAARQAWRNASAVWQRAELFTVGPAASSIADPGGADLRDEIYSWPTVNTCRVDQEIVSQAYTSPDFTATQLVNVYGLDALEYLLFQDTPDNTCPPQSSINGGPWAAIAGELTARRMAYSAAIANDLVLKATALRDAWDPTAGGFTALFVDPGVGASPYEHVGEVFNAVFRGMFYLDLSTKDKKLAQPTGLDGTCPTESCPDRLESRWAHASREHLLANLNGFEQVFYGGPSASEGMGFDDFLVHVGAGSVATDLAQAIDGARASLTASTLPLDQALAQELDSVKTIHAAFKRITDILKGPFHVALNLDVPEEGAGDAD